MVSGISPAESNLVIVERNQTVVGDRDTMRVGANVAEHLVGSAEGWFAVDHPVVAEKLADKSAENLRLGEGLELPMELEFAGGKRLLECLDEFATENLAEDSYREKEVAIPGRNPMRVIRRKAPGGNDAVNVGMMLQLLIPGMEDAEEPDFGAEMLGVGGDFQQRLSTAAEQQSVDYFFVLQGQRPQLVGKRKHDMSVRRGEQLGATRS